MVGDDEQDILHDNLILAVNAGSREIVEDLLGPSDLSEAWADGYVLLCQAIEHRHFDVAKFLLIKGAKVNSSTSTSETPLHLAVRADNETIIEMIIERDANLYAENGRGETPFDVAIELKKPTIRAILAKREALKQGGVKRGWEEISKLLSSEGDNDDVQESTLFDDRFEINRKMYIPVFKGALKDCNDLNNVNSRRSIVAEIINRHCRELGAIVDNLLIYGITLNPEILHSSYEKGYLTAVEELLNYGARNGIDPKLYNFKFGKGFAVFHRALEHRFAELVKLFVSYGVEVNTIDVVKRTPLFYAVENKSCQIVHLLLTNGAIINSPDYLYMAVAAGCKLIMRLLLDHGADIYASDKHGRIALHYTAGIRPWPAFSIRNQYEIYMEEMVEELIFRGSNVNARTKEGKTTLYIAAEEGCREVAEVLLKYNANINSTYGENTPLNIAILRGHGSVAEVLLKFGARIDFEFVNKEKPLHIAAREGNVGIVEILLKCGVGIDSTDESGKTALFISSVCKERSVVEALLEQGADINIIGENDRINPTNTGEYYCCGVITSKGIAKIFAKHVVTRKSANLYISEKILRSFDHLTDILGEYIIQCEEEIEKMKSEKISNSNISFHHISSRSINELALYARNENIVQAFKWIDYDSKFPIYGTLLNRRFKRAMKRRELLEQGRSFFNHLPNLPSICIDKILSYPSCADLMILTEFCEPTDVDGSDISTKMITSSCTCL